MSSPNPGDADSGRRSNDGHWPDPDNMHGAGLGGDNNSSHHDNPAGSYAGGLGQGGDDRFSTNPNLGNLLGGDGQGPEDGGNGNDDASGGAGGDGDDLNLGIGGAQGIEDAAVDDTDDLYDMLPPWANEENRAISALVRKKEQMLQKSQKDVQETVDRIGIMAEHLKNVRQEHVHTQALLDAKAREIATEEHLRKLSERNLGRLQLQLRTVSKEIDQAQDESNSLQNELFAANEKLEKFKLQMNWNQEELLEWSTAIKQKEEDKEVIERYHRQDNARLKQLVQTVEKNSRALREAQASLQQEIVETRAVQMELDSLAEAFKREHQQRQELLRQWDESMKTLNRHDQEILERKSELVKQIQRSQELEKHIQHLTDVLQKTAADYNYQQGKLVFSDRALSHRREEVRGQEEIIARLEDDVLSQQSETSKAKLELAAAKRQLDLLQQKHEEWKKRNEGQRRNVEATKQQLEAAQNDTKQLTVSAEQIEKLYQTHKDQLAQLDKALQAVKDAMFKHSHELFNLRKTEANLIAEISGAQGASRNLQARIRELDQRSLKQQEMLYSIEFQVQQLERKVAHSSGKRSVEETMQLNKKIASLHRVLEQTKAQSAMLSGQIRRLQDDLRAAYRANAEAVEKKAALKDKLAAAQLEVETEEREVKKCIAQKQELAIQHDEMSLEVKRLTELLKTKQDSIYELEQRKLQLELAMKEREKEISLHRDVQRAEYKANEEARHQVAMDLRERQIKLDRCKAKYDTLAGKLRGSLGNQDGEERTQAYYIIKAAQEREELQTKGDELNNTIRRAEKEILMLAKTLKSLNIRNQQLRESFHTADPEGPDMQLKAQLEQKMKQVTDALYKKKSILREITADFEERRKLLAELISDIAAVGKEVQSQDKDLTALRKQLTEQDLQLQRATKLSQQKRAEYRRLHQIAKGETTAEELYVALQEIKRANTISLDMLKVFMEEHPNTQETIQEILDDMGINIEKYTMNRRGGNDGNGSSGPSSGGPPSSPGPSPSPSPPPADAPTSSAAAASQPDSSSDVLSPIR